MDDTYQPLADELSCWQDGGLRCRFWWRDDDLIAVSQNLRRMHLISERHVIYVLVAVIPRLMEATLARDTVGMHNFVWCQHGYAHTNHEREGGPDSEFPVGRPKELIVEDLAAGRGLLLEQFSDRLCPVLVPPWNGFREDLVAELPTLGLTGLSQYGRVARQQIAQTLRVDTHIDVVCWATAPRFPSGRATSLLAQLVNALRRRRQDRTDGGGIGILTHHRAMDDVAWDFMENLLTITHSFPCVEWVSPRDLFSSRQLLLE